MLAAKVKSAASRIVTITVAVFITSRGEARGRWGAGIYPMCSLMDGFGRRVTRTDRPARDAARPQRRSGVGHDVDVPCDRRGDLKRRVAGLAQRASAPTRRHAGR